METNDQRCKLSQLIEMLSFFFNVAVNEDMHHRLNDRKQMMKMCSMINSAQNLEFIGKRVRGYLTVRVSAPRRLLTV